MDQIRTGALIRQLRTEQHMTQKQLAERLCVSDKAVSKWECGNGCPDVSLLPALADVLGTDIQVLLSGEINKQKGACDMKKLRFYVCKACGNIITAAAEASVTCCGSRLAALEPRKAEPSEQLSVEDIGGELYISAAHPMTKEHYISFVAYVNASTVLLYRQYPEWDLQVRMPAGIPRSGRLVWYCTECGLLYQPIRPSNS